ATPCGGAKNTRAHSDKGASSEDWKLMSTWPRKLGNKSATGKPLSWREVTATISALGCCASNRNSSTPVYPVAPTIPTLIGSETVVAILNPHVCRHASIMQ